ncbi:hypothetical protein NQ318_016057 [Aromia moschata]|uniref:Uncharacterized protein n=1 Tax=Aromia moschata TaxID=1265417 RepID=A0AAV8XS16_9CUCU|nr:hypothetical protein NQ318_016057 [Aromia moschata]
MSKKVTSEFEIAPFKALRRLHFRSCSVSNSKCKGFGKMGQSCDEQFVVLSNKLFSNVHPYFYYCGSHTSSQNGPRFCHNGSYFHDIYLRDK